MQLNPKLNAITYLGSKTSSNSISLPSYFNELICMVKVDNNDNVQIPVIIPYECLSTSVQRFANGYYMAGSSMCAGVRIEATKTNAQLYNAYLNTADKRTTSVTYYYYR